jgi:hypothetical protein
LIFKDLLIILTEFELIYGTVFILAFNHNLLYFRRTSYPVVNMQIIDAVGQIGDIELYLVAFGGCLA